MLPKDALGALLLYSYDWSSRGIGEGAGSDTCNLLEYIDCIGCYSIIM